LAALLVTAMTVLLAISCTATLVTVQSSELKTWSSFRSMNRNPYRLRPATFTEAEAEA
jgi:hypothetical protein